MARFAGQIPSRLVSAIVTAVVVVCCAAAWGGGLEIPDLGTVAIGRGTAFVARADNLSAFHYNPAGLAKSKGPNLLLGINLIHLDVGFTRAGSDMWIVGGPGGEPVAECPPGEICIADPALDYGYFPEDATSYRRVTSASKLGPAPMVVFSWGDVFGVEGLALAAGLLPPSSFGAPSFPKEGPQRYALRSAHHLIAFPGIGAAYAINRYIQVGAVFLSGFALLEQHQAIRPVPQLNNDRDYNERRDGDADLLLDADDPFVPTAIVGLLSNPVDWLEIGASVRFPARIEAEGTLEYTAPTRDMPDSHLAPGRDKVVVRQHFPWLVRTGVRYVHRLFDVEVDFVWENWSSLRAFEVDIDAAIDEGNGSLTEMPDAEVPKHFRDTYSVRVGGDVEVWPEHLAVRLGGYYQSSAHPEDNSTFNLDFPFGEQFGLGGGLTWHSCRWLDVNVGYLHVFQKDVVVTRGVVQQQGLPLVLGEIEQVIGNTVNNGKYEVSANLFGLSLEGHFN